MGHRITLQDVAGRAGVSQATVSLVLNQRMDVRISAPTRARVQAIALELGYQPNGIARSLVRGRTQTIGVIVPTLASVFNASIVDGIEDTCSSTLHRVLLAHSRHDPEHEARHVEMFLEHQVDGVICLACEATAARMAGWIGRLATEHVPCVVIDEDQSPIPVDHVISDDTRGSIELMRHLIALGHRRIAHIGGGSRSSSARNRRAGYRAALTEAGIVGEPGLLAGDSYQADLAHPAIERLLDQGRPPTAIFAANDILAGTARDIILARGWTIPSDIALVGFGNEHLAPYIDLTTVNQYPRLMGRRAVELLMARLADPGRDVTGCAVPTAVVVRGSCGAGLRGLIQ